MAFRAMMDGGRFDDDWGATYQSLIEERWRRLSQIDDERLGLAQRRQLTWLARQMEGRAERIEGEPGGRSEEFVEQLWREFTASPTPGLFERLKECALRLDQWPQWRASAFEFLRRRANESTGSPAKKRSSLASAVSSAYNSERVRIWLAEGEVEEAYRAAVDGDCADARRQRTIAARRKR